MRTELKWWTSLPKETKQQLKEHHNITIVTFQWIEMIYNLKNK
jgi:hypothetical protein